MGSLMVGLARWLGQQLDEDERIARATTVRQPYDEWDAVGAGDHDDVARSHWEVVKIARMAQSPAARSLAIHIAEWDPARVLREINAKRKLLRRANGGVDYPHTHPGEDDANHLARHHDDELLRLLALPYADREGYLPEWTPTD